MWLIIAEHLYHALSTVLENVSPLYTSLSSYCSISMMLQCQNRDKDGRCSDIKIKHAILYLLIYLVYLFTLGDKQNRSDFQPQGS